MVLDPRFYLCIAGAYVLMQLAPNHRRCLWFGLLNLVALFTLFQEKLCYALILGTIGLWVGLRVLQALKGTTAKVWLGLVYAGTVGAFLFHKSFLDPSGLLKPLHTVLVGVPGAAHLSNLLVTVAFSYIFIRVLDIIRSVSEGARLLDPLSMTGYVFPFFMTAAGPINVYADHVGMDKQVQEKPRFEAFLSGVETIVAGLFLKIVIAELYRYFFIGVNQPWPLGSVKETVIAFIYVFFDFFGYSLVALGVGRLLGVPTPVNFDRPWKSVTVTEFWTRWHKSLGTFVLKNVFIPVQLFLTRRYGVKRAHYTGFIGLVASFGFVGLWHNFSWQFLVWGVSLSLIMSVEKYVRDKKLSSLRKNNPKLLKAMAAVGPVYVFVVVVGTLHFVMKQLMGAS